MYCKNRISYGNFKLTFCTCAQSMDLGARIKIQFEIITVNVTSGNVYFREIIFENAWSDS